MMKPNRKGSSSKSADIVADSHFILEELPIALVYTSAHGVPDLVLLLSYKMTFVKAITCPQ